MHEKHREAAAVEGRPASERERQAAGRWCSVGAWTGMSIKYRDSCRRATHSFILLARSALQLKPIFESPSSIHTVKARVHAVRLQGYRSHQRVLQGEIVLLLPDRRFATPKSIKECCLFNEGHTVGDSVTIFNMGYTHQRILPQHCTLSWMGALMAYTKSPNAKESKTKCPSDTAISGYVLTSFYDTRMPTRTYFSTPFHLFSTWSQCKTGKHTPCRYQLEYWC